jgi:DNA-binding response OmpR family regulator
MPKKILVVEDDPSIRFGLQELLSGEGYTVETLDRGDGVVEECLRRFSPEMILLDVMLPGRNGYAACRDLRAAGVKVPILMLTAKGQELDKVLGLEVGADDYLTKPFGVRELVARIQALWRRVDGYSAHAATVPEVFVMGDCSVDPANFSLTRNGKMESLTPKEMALLIFLYRHAGKLLSREKLLQEVWGVNYFGTTRTLDQTIAQVRKKLGNPDWVQTIHGVGYKLLVPS